MKLNKTYRKHRLIRKALNKFSNGHLIDTCNLLLRLEHILNNELKMDRY